MHLTEFTGGGRGREGRGREGTSRYYAHYDVSLWSVIASCIKDTCVATFPAWKGAKATVSN